MAVSANGYVASVDIKAQPLSAAAYRIVDNYQRALTMHLPLIPAIMHLASSGSCLSKGRPQEWLVDRRIALQD